MKGAHTSDTVKEEVSKHPSLGVNERLSIVNALMEQDRIEIRERQEAVFRLTYLVVPGFIAIAAFSVDHADLKRILILALLLILAIFLVSFFTFNKWLKDARACQQIREAYYQRQDLLYSDPFTPIRPINKEDRKLRFKDHAVWFPFAVTLLSAAALFTYMLLA
jgi:hypothetical protein